MTALTVIYFFIFGLLVGSFLNVVILRLPLDKDLVFKRSHCPKCLKQLSWYHNIPLLSFIFLRGKCAFCREKISWQYPIIEFITGLISLVLIPDSWDGFSLFHFVFKFSVACIFLCHFIIDLRHQLLPDKLNLYLLAFLGCHSLLTFGWPHWLWGALMGFGIPLSVTWVFYKIRGQIGLGGGDIKLYGILGLYLGPLGIMFNIFMSCFIGAIVGLVLIGLGKMTKDRPMAFGPAIIVVATVQIFVPEASAYIQSFFF